MKPQAGQFQVIQRLRVVYGIQNLQTPLLQILTNLRALSGLKEGPEPFMVKRHDHRRLTASMSGGIWPDGKRALDALFGGQCRWVGMF
jgi:hypothetical protein